MMREESDRAGHTVKFHRRGIVAMFALWPLAAVANTNLGDGWILLRESKVNLLKNFLIVPVTLANGLFSGIVIEAVDKPLFIESVEVIFTNGETVDLPVRSIIRAGSRTRKMLLPGWVRGIRAIKVIHKRVPTGGSSTVRIYGRQTKL